MLRKLEKTAQFEFHGVEFTHLAPTFVGSILGFKPKWIMRATYIYGEWKFDSGEEVLEFEEYELRNEPLVIVAGQLEFKAKVNPFGHVDFRMNAINLCAEAYFVLKTDGTKLDVEKELTETVDIPASELPSAAVGEPEEGEWSSVFADEGEDTDVDVPVMEPPAADSGKPVEADWSELLDGADDDKWPSIMEGLLEDDDPLNKEDNA